MPGDPFGGPAKVEKVIRVEMVEDWSEQVFFASTIPGDHSGGPAEVEKVIRVEMYEIGANRFWLVYRAYWVTRR